MATGIHAQAVAAEFLEHAKKYRGMLTRSQRITQLDGAPDFNPETLAKSESFP
jgi:bacterioferritin